MKELDEYLKTCNLVFTDTVDRLDFCKVDFDIDSETVNYDDSISLLKMVSSFNKLYSSFKKEYDELPKLNLGEHVEVLNYANYSFDNDDYRTLFFYVEKPTMTNHSYTYLYLREINDEIKPFVSNNKNVFDKKYYRHDIKLNNEIAKKYLDLFQKYELLLNSYQYFKNKLIFGDGTHCIITTIDNYHNSSLLEGLHQFKIFWGSAYFDTEYFIELPINLGDNFGIDYDNCKIVLDGKEIKIDKEEFDRILANVFVNEQYTKERKKQSF